MKYFFIIILILLTLSCFGQKEFYKDHQYYVWAYSGINLHETSEINSRILTIIPYGSKITIDSLLEDNNDLEVTILDSIKINNGSYTGGFIKGKTASCSLKGKMVRINYREYTGYIFNGFLSEFEPIFESFNIYDLDKIFEKRYGILTILDKSRNEEDYGNKQIIFKNGFIYYREDGNAWFVNTYLLKDITFQEGLLIAYNFIKRNNSNSQEPKWFIKEKDDKYVKFHMETGMYESTIRQVNNILILTISGSN